MMVELKIFSTRTLKLLMLAGALAFAGCKRMEMAEQPKNKPLTASDFFEDGMSARPLIEGTVSRGNLRIDTRYYQGTFNGHEIAQLPEQVKLTQALLDRGKQRYTIYCTECHGRLGDGNGMIPARGLKHPPSYHDQRLRDAPIGHFFDVMTRGYGVMFDYAAQVSVPDRWAIAAYIRVLQLSQNAGPMLDESQRRILKEHANEPENPEQPDAQREAAQGNAPATDASTTRTATPTTTKTPKIQ